MWHKNEKKFKMTLTCCTSPSFFNIWFGACLGPINRYKLGNKVGITNNLKDIADDTSNSVQKVQKVDILQGNTDIKNCENQADQSNESETPPQEVRANEVIVEQPINNITIVNVPYRQTLYKNVQRRISNAVTGHVKKVRNSFDSSSVETSSEGKEQHKGSICLGIFRTYLNFRRF